VNKDHRCELPDSPEPTSRQVRCPKCQTRYFWSRRMIGREMREGWSRAPVSFDDRVRVNQAEFNRAARWMLPLGVVGFLLALAVVVWAVYRFTS